MNGEQAKPEVVEFQGADERQGRRIGRLFETERAEDGTPFEVRWVEKERMFYVVPVAGIELQSQNPDALRVRLRAWIRENLDLAWEPVIALDASRWRGEGDFFGLNFCRFFRAPRKDVEGGYVWRNFDPGRDLSELGKQEFEDIVEGHPGAVRNGVNRDSVIIPYTPSRWLELRRARKAFEAMKEMARKFVEGRSAEDVAQIIDGGRAPFLLANPRDDAKPKVVKR